METVHTIDQSTETTGQRNPETVTHADAEAAVIRAGLQQWLGEFVDRATHIPDEGITVELPGFDVPTAKVVRGDGNIVAVQSVPANENDPPRTLVSTMKM